LNETLGHDEKNLVCFDRLLPGNPARALMMESIMGQLLSAKRYQDILKDAQPGTIFSGQVENLKAMLAGFGQNEAMKERMEKVFRKKTVSTGAHYLEALAGVQRTAEARTLADQILNFDSTDETKGELARAAERAGNSEVAKYIRSK
jgi:hypothetical protein